MTQHLHRRFNGPGPRPARRRKTRKGKQRCQENKGVRNEWHLLNLPWMPMPADFLPCKRPRFREQRIGFRSSLDGAGLDASGAVTHALFGDQYEQTVEHIIVVGAGPVMVPGDPDLQRVLEA